MQQQLSANVFDSSGARPPPVRPPAVAGMFYPGNAAQLAQNVGQMLADAANAIKLNDSASPKAIIAPHAGYVYSGTVAASIYARLLPWRRTIRRVLLLGPAHRVALQGLALPSATAFQTPLGYVQLDQAAIASINEMPQVHIFDATHAQEHSLEVQLPFLQMLLKDGFSLVPLVVGQASPEDVAAVLDRLWGGHETLIVISSDLSHYHPYAEAQDIDRNTCARVLALQNDIVGQQACGAGPINGLLHCAAFRGLKPELVQLKNSGDTAGDKSRVVGYASFAFHDPAAQQDANGERKTLGQTLISLARMSIHRHLGSPLPADHHVPLELPLLEQPGATFVTLTQDGRLRGCIGSLVAHRSLRDDVETNAINAAVRDSRFEPLRAEELSNTCIEVSLLSAPEPLAFQNEAEALARLRPLIDGVIFQEKTHQATFLPQVWEQLPDAKTFMARLKQKAGLAADYWSNDVRLLTYKVEKWKASTQA